MSEVVEVGQEVVVPVTRAVRRLGQGASTILGGGKEDVKSPRPPDPPFFYSSG